MTGREEEGGGGGRRRVEEGGGGGRNRREEEGGEMVVGREHPLAWLLHFPGKVFSTKGPELGLPRPPFIRTSGLPLPV